MLFQHLLYQFLVSTSVTVLPVIFCLKLIKALSLLSARKPKLLSLTETSTLKIDHTFLTHISMLRHKLWHSILLWSWCLCLCVAAYASIYRCGSRRCDLCLTEKYVIARANHKNLSNKRIELISKCRHKNKHILKNIK